MTSFLICSSTRKRPDWASLPAALLRSSTMNSRWRETRLDTHDVAMPLPTIDASSRRVLRAILVSPHHVGSEDTRARIERLYHLNGGRDVAVIFLLKQCEGLESPMAMLMKLQLDLVVGREIPIIPVDSVATVPTTLMTLHRQLGSSRKSLRSADPAHTLLPFCSDTQPLSEHSVNVLTDITSGVRDMLEKASCPISQVKVVDYLENEAGKVISFWKEEYLLE
ncbi:hypothetical protein F5X99DRAFT_257674 [Biscogniauxia marginata]|nr:hypothetical protein F5X99DRAFT_257674 [Biscogniauxia marginata]